MNRIVVTGAGGQLGSTMVARLSATSDVHAFTRSQLDIADEAAVLAALTPIRPEVLINCAAYNDVDGAEEAATTALSTNALGVLALARSATVLNAKLVHYSTDFVFDGNTDRPYVETDPPRPLSTYGTSKLLGEWFASETPRAYVVRVESLFGGQRAKSSIDKILASVRAGQAVRVLADRTVTPSYVDDIVTATEQLLRHELPYGIYHCVNSGTATWLDIAKEAARLLQLDAEIVPVNIDDLKLKARRPRRCALSNHKLEQAGIAMPDWQHALARYVQSVQGRA
jgi:dTDP-4-dehydrorhamnose reductase